MIVAAVVAMGPALQAAIHTGLQIEARRKAAHSNMAWFTSLEFEGQIGDRDRLTERVVRPVDLVLDRGDFAVRYRSVGFPLELGAGEVMRLAGRPLLEEDRQRRIVELKHRPAPQQISMPLPRPPPLALPHFG